MNCTDRLIAHEAGELDQEETARLFQELIDSGLVWKLQGHFGRMAICLINRGDCQPTSRIVGNTIVYDLGGVPAK